MITKGFYINDVEHTVTILGYEKGHPAKTDCDPDDGHEGSDWEIDLDGVVDVENGDALTFEDFITEYAKDHCSGDERKALERVERDCRLEVLDH